MKRYKAIRYSGMYAYPGSPMTECKDGAWVLVVEAEAEITRLRARVSELIDECDELRLRLERKTWVRYVPIVPVRSGDIVARASEEAVSEINRIRHSLGLGPIEVAS